MLQCFAYRVLNEANPPISLIVSHCRNAVPMCGPSMTRYCSTAWRNLPFSISTAPSHAQTYLSGPMSADGANPPARSGFFGTTLSVCLCPNLLVCCATVLDSFLFGSAQSRGHSLFLLLPPLQRSFAFLSSRSLPAHAAPTLSD